MTVFFLSLSDECATTPCANGGVCVADPTLPAGYRCICPALWTGDICTERKNSNIWN